MAPGRPSPCGNRTLGFATERALSQASGFALAYLAVLFVAEPNTHGATFLSRGGGGRDIPGTTGTTSGRCALVLSSVARCCDRNAGSRVPGSIVTHGLPCPVEIEVPCRHTPGTEPGESPVCPGPAHKTAYTCDLSLLGNCCLLKDLAQAQPCARSGRPALNAKMVELKREFTSSPPDRARKTMSPEGFSLSLMVIGSLLWIPSLPPIEEVNLKILSLLNDSCIEQHLI